MNLNPSTWDPQTLSGIRNTLQALGGVAVAFGLVTATQAHDLIDKVGEIGAALGVIITAGGFIVSFVVGILGNRAASPAAQIATVATMTGPEKAAAMAAVPDTIKLAAVEALPDVKKIVVTAAATDGVAEALNDPSRTKVTANDPPFGVPLTRKIS